MSERRKEKKKLPFKWKQRPHTANNTHADDWEFIKLSLKNLWFLFSVNLKARVCGPKYTCEIEKCRRKSYRKKIHIKLNQFYGWRKSEFLDWWCVLFSNCCWLDCAVVKKSAAVAVIRNDVAITEMICHVNFSFLHSICIPWYRRMGKCLANLHISQRHA